MPRNAWITKPQARDVAMLYDLYRYRILTTEQIKRLYFSDSKDYVNQKLRVMRNSQLITTFTQKRSDRKGYACHRILQKGLDVLVEWGHDIKHKPVDLTVKPNARPYILTANDIMTHVTPYGWFMKDSRQVKQAYGLNSGDQIHGSLISPEKTEYGFFVLERDTLAKNLAKVVYEIRTTSKNDVGLTDFIIFAKGQESINHFIERANTEKLDHKGNVIQEKLRPSGSICVMHLDQGIDYLTSQLSNKSYFKNIFKKPDAPANWLAPSDKSYFECIADYKGEEVYIVNMLDTDLTKVDAINGYLGDRKRMERFGEKVRKVLVVTEESSVAFHKELIGQNQHIAYLSLKHKHMTSTVRDKAPAG